MNLLEAILIDREAFVFLSNKIRGFYGMPPWTEEQEEKWWNKCYKVRGKQLVTNSSYGTPNKDGSWHSWTVPEIKAMLTEAGHEYEETETVESISL